MRNITTPEEAKKTVALGVSAQDPIALLKKVEYNKDEIINKYENNSPEKISSFGKCHILTHRKARLLMLFIVNAAEKRQ